MTDIDYEKIAKELVAEKVTFCKGTDREHVSYEPVYFGQGYSDTNEEVMSAFVSGEQTKDGYPLWREMAEEAIEDWGGEAIWQDAGEIVEEYEKFLDLPLADDFDTDELRDEVRMRLQEVQTQDVALEWVRDMRAPIVRVMLTDEDHPDSWVENDADWTPQRIATNAGIEHSEKNLKACQVILDNAYYPGTVKMLFIVFRMDIPKDNDGDTVRITGEVELWATNPFTGDGMADTVDIDITIDRKELATDKEACGYSYDEVFGPSYHDFPEPDLTFITTKKEAAA
jgi:hypothetical protein